MNRDSAGRRGLYWWIDRWRQSSSFTGLSLAEQGALRNLLDEQRLRGGLIPSDERLLARACGDAAEWQQIRERVLARFERTPDGKYLFNRTATEVNATSDALSAKRTKAARKGFGSVTRGSAGRFSGAGIDKVKGDGKVGGHTGGQSDGVTGGQTTVIRNPLSVAVSDTGEDSGQACPHTGPTADDSISSPEQEAAAQTCGHGTGFCRPCLMAAIDCDFENTQHCAVAARCVDLAESIAAADGSRPVPDDVRAVLESVSSTKSGKSLRSLRRAPPAWLDATIQTCAEFAEEQLDEIAALALRDKWRRQ